MDLATLFEFAVTRFPDCTAIVEGDQRFSYKQFNQQINRVANSLQEQGINKGDRVVIVLKNRLEMVTLYWAIQKIGAVFTPINFRLSPDEVAYCVNDAEAKAVVYEPASEEAVMAGKFNGKPLLISILDAQGGDVTYDQLLTQGKETFNRPNIADEEICLILYTSGTTGRPKGVPRSHKNEYGATVAHIIQNNYEIHESTIELMPLYHTMGMHSLTSITFLNGKLVMLPDYEPTDTLELLEREEVSAVYLVPTIIHDLLHHPGFDKYNLSNLTKLGYAGAPMTTALTNLCFEKLKPKIFVNHYGSTEIYTYSICNYLDKKPGCAGKPGFHQQLRVVKADREGNSTPDDIVPKNTPGEIILNIKSIESFNGYLNRPDATRKAIRNGWYFTGDLGMIDEDGDLYVVGRVDDMFISGGENIHPLEVEDVLSAHPKVLEVVVTGTSDDRWGEIVTAYVVPRDDSVTAEELDQFCKQSSTLSNFKRPRKYYFVKEIPKSPVGKVLRRRLKDSKTLNSKESVL